MRMRDEKGEDTKILAVPDVDPAFNEIKDISDVPKHILKEIEHYFTHYKDLEPGKWTKVEGWLGASDAIKLIEEAIKLYKEKWG
ncbi:MAG: inorganic diphosphatase, partial [Candidatus Nezhaarchaeales archaeon]